LTKDKTVTFIKVDDFKQDFRIPNISLKHIEKTGLRQWTYV